MDDIQAMLDEEYERTLEAVSNSTAGSEEAKWGLQKLAELHRQRIAERKASDESFLQVEELQLKKADVSLKKEQLKEGRKDRWIRIVLDGAAILIPTAASCYWMSKGLKFEETGSFTSKTGQWLSCGYSESRNSWDELVQKTHGLFLFARNKHLILWKHNLKGMTGMTKRVYLYAFNDMAKVVGCRYLEGEQATVLNALRFGLQLKDENLERVTVYAVMNRAGLYGDFIEAVQSNDFTKHFEFMDLVSREGLRI